VGCAVTRPDDVELHTDPAQLRAEVERILLHEADPVAALCTLIDDVVDAAYETGHEDGWQSALDAPEHEPRRPVDDVVGSL
jgi:hypothetical protein